MCCTGALTFTTSAAFSFGDGSTPLGFILDFQPDPSGDKFLTEGSFGGGFFGFGGFGGGWGNADEKTSFLQENVAGSYIHQIIGTPEEGFVQEVYIQATRRLAITFRNPTASGNTGMNNPFGPGNASANPEKVIMRQLVFDSESRNEFLKDVWLAKPVITSTVTDGGIESSITIDMNEISYQDDTTAAPITSTLIFTEALLDLENRPADFNMATDVQDSTITAGRYTYSEGSGSLGSQGTYSYIGGNGFNKDDINWASFCDTSQNLTVSNGFGGWRINGDYCEGGSSAGGADSFGGFGGFGGFFGR